MTIATTLTAPALPPQSPVACVACVVCGAHSAVVPADAPLAGLWAPVIEHARQAHPGHEPARVVQLTHGTADAGYWELPSALAQYNARHALS